MEGPEWDSQDHDTVQSGSRAEETEISGGGGEVGHRQDFQRLWDPPGYGDPLQIPGVGDIGDGRQLVSDGEELVPGEEVLD